MKRADEVSENEKTGEGESVTFPTSILINSILPKENKPITESLESPAIINRPIKPLSIRKVVEGEKEVPPVQVKLSTAQVGSLRHFFLVVSSKDKTITSGAAWNSPGFFGHFEKNSSRKKTQANFRKTQANYSKTQ